MSFQCASLLKGGARCPNPAAEGRAFCQACSNEPAIAAEGKPGRRTKARTRTHHRDVKAPDAIPPELLEIPPLNNPPAIHVFLERVMMWVLSGIISPNQGQSVARLCDVKLRMADLELQARLAVLERAVQDAYGVRLPGARHRPRSLTGEVEGMEGESGVQHVSSQ